MLLINCFLSTIALYGNYGEEQELQNIECMSFIEDILHGVAENSNLEIKLNGVGDFNANEAAIYNDNKLFAVKHLFTELHFQSCDYLDRSNVGYTSKQKSMDISSYIDHYFVSQNVISNIEYVTVVDNGINLSDHCPIVCVLQNCVSCSQENVSTNEHTIKSTSIVNFTIWNDENCQFYSYDTLRLLSQIPLLSMSCMKTDCMCM